MPVVNTNKKINLIDYLFTKNEELLQGSPFTSMNNTLKIKTDQARPSLQPIGGVVSR